MTRPPGGTHAARPRPTDGAATAAATVDDRRPIPIADPGRLRRVLLAWYDAEGRSIPFRATADPWAILVSEAMAQQTQAARAAAAWTSFMATFPTPASLAAASPAEVLRAWRGLGYNRRAVDLQRAARRIVELHGGRVPDEVAALLDLPGVGPYTARAVAAIAFGRPVGAVDTNVRRVLTRLVGEAPGAVPGPAVQRLADALVDPERSGDWTHALMDVGATRCRPARPDCDRCPLAPWCRTAASPTGGSPAVGPVDGGRGSRPTAHVDPFPSTTRWLRGRIVERLRDAGDGDWVRIDGPVGSHDDAAVAAALETLARDGLIERHPREGRSARLPTSRSDR